MECAKGSRLFVDESVSKSILATFHSSDKLMNATKSCIVSEFLQQTPFCYLNKKVPGAQPTTPVPSGQIIGNRASKIYHSSNCPDYSRFSKRNRIPFKTEAEAEAAGYRKALNCPL